MTFLNKSEELITPKEFCTILGISYSTYRRWVVSGKIKVIKLPNGRYRVPFSEIERIIGKPVRLEGNRAIIYARVSSKKQQDQGDLDRQIDALVNTARRLGYQIVDVIYDVGSGLNENRRGLRKLFDYVVNKKVDVVFITHKDRLTRFGYKYLEYFFKQFGVKIHPIMDDKDKTYLEELVEDFVSIVVSFAAKIYGKRSHKVEKLKNLISEELSDVSL